MARITDNHYARLGVPKDATHDEILKAYREVARRYHPDTRQEQTGTELFLGVQEAYEVLSNPTRRAAYDFTLPSLDFSSGVEVDIEYSRTALLSTPEPQLLYVLLTLKVLENAKFNTPPPLNLCIVIDRSTSMSGGRMEMVKATARQLLRQLREEDTLSIVAFSDRAQVIVPPTRGANLTRIDAQIGLIQAGGATEIYQGLKAGIDQVSSHMRSGVVNQVILITDGHTYGDEEGCYTLAEHAKTAGITISGMGIGAEWNDQFLDDITAKTGGNSLYVSSPRDIKRFLEQKFKGITKTYAESLRLDGELPDHIELRYGFRIYPEPAKLPVDQFPVALGSLMEDHETMILLEFLVKDLPLDLDEIMVMDGKLRMEIPKRVIPAARVFVKMLRPASEELKPDPPPAKIMDAMSKLTLYRMQEQARIDLSMGRVKEATRRLQNLATNLLAQGESQLARQVLIEAKRLQRGEQPTEDGGKEIKYGTRNLLLPAGMELDE